MKTICIYHSIDLDGWMSAAIVKHWFSKQEVPTDTPGVFNTIEFLGYTYGDPIPDLSEYDKVIMCGISFPKSDTINLAKRLGLNFIWNDPHVYIINIFHCSDVNGYYPEGNRDVKFAACELTWKYLFPNKPMPEIVRLLGIYNCFVHKGTDEEKKVLEFQYGARGCITNYEEAYEWLILAKHTTHLTGIENVVERIQGRGRTIYKYIKVMAKSDYAMGFTVRLEEVVGDITYLRKFICINKERFNPINFGIDYHADGYDGAICFHYANNMWNFSIYNDNGLVDCSTIAVKFGGGGHKGDSGFRLGDINVFLQNYKQY